MLADSNRTLSKTDTTKMGDRYKFEPASSRQLVVNHSQVPHCLVYSILSRPVPRGPEKVARSDKILRRNAWDSKFVCPCNEKMMFLEGKEGSLINTWLAHDLGNILSQAGSYSPSVHCWYIMWCLFVLSGLP